MVSDTSTPTNNTKRDDSLAAEIDKILGDDFLDSSKKDTVPNLKKLSRDLDKLLDTLSVDIANFINYPDSPKKVESFIDTRDKNSYKFICANGICWMLDNMRYAVNMGQSPDANNSNVKEYGLLYSWEEAKKVCPKGWHLPSDEEWKKIEMFYGMSKEDADKTNYRGKIAKKMKSTKGWDRDGNGDITESDKDSHFMAYPSGKIKDGTNRDLKLYAYFWSASEKNENEAYSRVLYAGDEGDEYDFLMGDGTFLGNEVGRLVQNKKEKMSCRCVKD
jgi:uncharacterized protein (TIGR02145 family)